jgi:hypothetical protein
MVREKFNSGQTVWGFEKNNGSNDFEGLDNFWYRGLYQADGGKNGWCKLSQEGDARTFFRLEKNLYHTRPEALEAKAEWLKSKIKTHREIIDKETIALRNSMDTLWDTMLDIKLPTTVN